MPRNPREIRNTLAALRNIHIETNQRDLSLKDHLSRLLELDEDGNFLPVPVRFTANLETRGIALIEAAGGGKTTAIRRLLASIPTLGLDPETGMARYVEVTVPNPATQKRIGKAILKAVGVEDVSERTPAWEMFRIARHRMSLLGIAVLWIDEAHDLFLSGSAREIDEMLKTLKSLMQGDSAVIVILSGTERLKGITSFDPQVSRRFSKIFPPDLQQGADNADLEDLIRSYCAEAGLVPDLTGDLAGRLIHASRKRFGRAIETLIDAIECALREGGDRLGIEHFAEAWGMKEGCPWNENVFVVPDWSSVVLDEEAAQYEAARTARQLKILEKA